MNKKTYTTTSTELIAVSGRHNILDDLIIHVSGINSGLGDAKQATMTGNVWDEEAADDEEKLTGMKHFNLWED